ncbi:MAG: hypothetical protein JRG89_03585 [Deltaproteobacteria bacterium]|nr:hypothetical protein [Deltaproteobacteria bacterium]
MSELDDGLERLHLCGFEYADGVPNYGPMAVEALESLGHAALISGLLDVYVPRLPDLVEGRPLRDDERSSARGRFEHAADWLASYEQALERAPWPEVLVEAAEAVAEASEDPDAPGPTLHGLIRVGHAVRSLSRDDNPLRRRELAFALAYWTARKEPGGESAKHDQWVDRFGPVPEEAEALGRWLSAVCLAGAERYLSSPEHRVSLSLGVMAPSAFRSLVPHVPTRLWQPLLIALLSSLEASLPAQVREQTADELEDREVERCAESPSEVRYRAACSVHEHAIMMAEVCLREDAFAADATLRRAAADAALRLSPPGYREWR